MSIQRIPPLVVLISLFKTLFLVITFRVRFRKDRLNKTFVADDGQEFVVFRDLQCRRFGKPDPAPAVFVVRFKFAKGDSKTNRRMSRVPIPLFIGHAGFLEKIWVENLETGYWQGIYQWKSEAAAQAYTKSFVLGKMRKRSVPESLTTEIIADMNINDYMNRHLKVPDEKE